MGGDTGAMGRPRVLLLMILVGWEKSLGLNWNPVPRKTVRYQGKLAEPDGTFTAAPVGSSAGR